MARFFLWASLWITWGLDFDLRFYMLGRGHAASADREHKHGHELWGLLDAFSAAFQGRYVGGF